MRSLQVKKIMKKNQVIITSLAILIAVAGYLNFADVDLGKGEKEASADSGSILDEVSTIDYDLTDQSTLLEENGTLASGTEETSSMLEDIDTPGEAILTGATNFAAQAKLSREQVRSQNKADLQAIIDNQELSQEQKQEAVSTMVAMTETAEKEAAAELLLEAQGFENVIVNLTGGTADVIVPDNYLDDSSRAQIEDIVRRKAEVSTEQIVITPLSQSSDEADAEDVESTEDSQQTEESKGADGEQETWAEDTVADYDYTQEDVQ